MLASACSGPGPQGLSPGESGSPPPTSAAPGAETGIVYATSHPVDAAPSELWLYSARDDQLRRLTSDEDEQIEHSPGFVGPETIAYVADGILYTLDPVTGDSSEVLRSAGVSAFAWNQPRGLIAFLAQRPVEPSGAGPHDLFFYSTEDGTKRLIKRFAGPRSSAKGHGDGDTPGIDDDIALTWSPDGSRLLVVDTLVDPPEEHTLYVFDSDGREVVQAQAGTQGVWSADSQHVYFRLWNSNSRESESSSAAPTRWLDLDVGKGTTTRLAISGGRMNPSLSPDGRFLAMDDTRDWSPDRRRRGCTCSIYLFDLATGEERRLITGFVGPLWLSSHTLVATRVRECVASECGVGSPMWVSLRESASISIPDGETAPLSLRSTLDADVLYQ